MFYSGKETPSIEYVLYIVIRGEIYVEIEYNGREYGCGEKGYI